MTNKNLSTLIYQAIHLKFYNKVCIGLYDKQSHLNPLHSFYLQFYYLRSCNRDNINVLTINKNLTVIKNVS